MIVKGAPFKGLLVQIRNVDDEIVGTVNKTGSIYKKTCDGRAMTHRNNNFKGRAKALFDLSENEMAQELSCV